MSMVTVGMARLACFSRLLVFQMNFMYCQCTIYRLSSVKGVRFRIANFASHFIRVQIFQIDFPLILSIAIGENFWIFL